MYQDATNAWMNALINDKPYLYLLERVFGDLLIPD